MSNKAVAPSGIRLDTFAYRNFQGVDTSRDDEALENPESQALVTLLNGYCDWRGQIIKDSGANHIDGGNRLIRHIDFYSEDILVWAQENEYAITLKSTNNVEEVDLWPAAASCSSNVFNHWVFWSSAGYPLMAFTGGSFVVASSTVLPAFGVSLSQRMAVAGMPNSPRRIDISRVNNPQVFEADEDASSTSVTRASAIDITNIIGSSEKITGLGVFENNRLAIFTEDRVLLYLIDPDLTEWRIDDRAQINVGCISHNTIKRAGSDLFYCSRDGVYSVRRNTENGIMVYSVPMSEKVTLLYRRLVRETEDQTKITSIYDRDEGQYHVFFPRPANTCIRLTLTLTTPRSDQDTGFKWSTGDFLQARCGAQLGGSVVVGTPGGIYELLDPEDETGEVYPEMVIRTPIFWTGSIRELKQSHSLILQADGEADMKIVAYDENGNFLASTNLVTKRSRDDLFPQVPLNRQHDRRFEHRYRGIQFEITVSGVGLFRLVGLGLNVKREK